MESSFCAYRKRGRSRSWLRLGLVVHLHGKWVALVRHTAREVPSALKISTFSPWLVSKQTQSRSWGSLSFWTKFPPALRNAGLNRDSDIPWWRSNLAVNLGRSPGIYVWWYAPRDILLWSGLKYERSRDISLIHEITISIIIEIIKLII